MEGQLLKTDELQMWLGRSAAAGAGLSSRATAPASCPVVLCEWRGQPLTALTRESLQGVFGSALLLQISPAENASRREQCWAAG